MINDRHFSGKIRLSRRVCGGQKHCENRLYNSEMADCKACAEEAFRAIEEATPLTMEVARPKTLKFEDIPDYGDHMAVAEFGKFCHAGTIKDIDGMGYYANESKMTNIPVYPSLFTCVVDHPYTHVVWFIN